MQEREIRIYKNKKGKAPVLKWLSAIKNNKIKNQIKNRIRRLSLSHFGDYKHVGNGVYELRVHFGPSYRIYFGFFNEAVIVLLSGGEKNKQQKDIEKAKLFWLDYNERYYEKN